MCENTSPPAQDIQAFQPVGLTFSLPLPCVECGIATQQGIVITGYSYTRGTELIPLCELLMEHSETAGTVNDERIEL